MAPVGHPSIGRQAIAGGGNANPHGYIRNGLPAVQLWHRPGISAHDALKSLSRELQFGGHQFVVEADIKGFFDNIQWEWLGKMLEQRIKDGAFLNLIRKWLRAGILEEDGKVIHPQT